MFTLLLFCCFFEIVSGTPNITTTHFLRDPEALVSNNGIFKIGFFSPTNSTSRYVGIWYNTEASNELEVIWVANRDTPVNSSSGVLSISEDGNLQLTDGNNIIYWSSNVSRESNGSVAQLLDTGSLVLLSGITRMIIWQSTDHLTNVIFPMRRLFDQNMAQRAFLQSWKSPSNPSSGNFTMTLVPGNLPEFIIQFDGNPYWRSGPWSGNHFLGMPEVSASAAYGFRFIYNDNEGTVDFLYSVENVSLMAHNLLNYDGNVHQKIWDYDSQSWVIVWQSMRSDCSVYGRCGPFGSCSPNESPICSCLRGFEPRNITEWDSGNWTGGCVRRTALQCSDAGSQADGFIRLNRMKVPDHSYVMFADDQDDCRRRCLQNCSCLAYAYPTGIGCIVWNGSLIDIQELAADRDDVFIRLAHSELGENSNLNTPIIIAAVVIVATAILVGFMYYLWKCLCGRHGNKDSDQLVDYEVGQAVPKDLTLFKFKQLEGATSNFLAINKLGEGGFGPVFKGILEDGQEVAIKRLSSASGQGLQEFLNEVLVISKLQHKNLVRLLGCCIEREEKLLVYEYLPHKSLDALLFDPSHKKELDWRKRFDIIKGICRGLLYLHRDSRLKIIHRDLKASNILLDEEFNPKISDFGMARIFGTKQNQANTLRVVGTYGYMSPEYAMEGRFSEQSDVFSFGVLLLEIISGRKNSSFFDSEYLSLLIYAWKLWNEENMISFVDPTIYDPSFHGEILKCSLLGLLCVQESPEDRPTISVLISMLEVDDIMDFPQPKQPCFTQRQLYSTDGSSSTWQEPDTMNYLSVTHESGR